MIEIALHLSSEDLGPTELVDAARAAEEAGLDTVTISDHYHPWHERQGSSPFVWSVIGGIAAATERLRVISAVTCPTVRTHPAIIAQAAATSAVMLKGRFVLGVGTGESLNEHILGDHWPPALVRLEMLTEAVEVMRLLWQGGEQSHDGQHYLVENARVWNLPDDPVPVWVSAFGPLAMDVAVDIGDGYVGTTPDADLVGDYKQRSGGSPAVALGKCVWDADVDTARRRLFQTWPNIGLPGELAQILPTTTHFEQAVELVSQDDVADGVPCGPDPEVFAESIGEYAEAGYDIVSLHHVGDDQAGFVKFLTEEVMPLME